MTRIIICADGTWNIRDQVDDATGKRRPTNVTKIARAMRSRDAKGVDQTASSSIEGKLLACCTADLKADVLTSIEPTLKTISAPCRPRR
jgi:hypothetical protein